MLRPVHIGDVRILARVRRLWPLVSGVCVALCCILGSSAWHPALAQSLTSNKSSYAANETIQVEYSGLPGNAQDWLTLVAEDAPTNTYGEWFYTAGKKAGSYTFKGLAPGAYQVRAYFNWPDGGFAIKAQLPIRVGAAAPAPSPAAPAPGSAKPTLKPGRASYAPGETIEVDFGGFPGAAQDWVTVVAKSAPSEQYAEWFYTEGRSSGRLSFKGLPAGAYEARAYFNWPSGSYKVQARAAFEVTGGAKPGALSLTTRQGVYVADQAIEVDFGGFSGAAYDWITIAAAGSPPEQYGEWYYTAGAKQGSFRFQGLAPGSYEVRGYFDWPAGGYAMRASHSFSVVENRTPVKETGVCANPKVLKLMDHWLATATPVDGDASVKSRFDAWGNVSGGSRQVGGRPTKSKLRRCAHLWRMAAQLKSKDRGTLKEYVERNQ